MNRFPFIVGLVFLSLALICAGTVQTATAATTKPNLPPSTSRTAAGALTPEYGGVLKMVYPVSPVNLGYPATSDGDSRFS